MISWFLWRQIMDITTWAVLIYRTFQLFGESEFDTSCKCQNLLCGLNKTTAFRHDFQLVDCGVLFCLQTSEMLHQNHQHSSLRPVNICLIACPASFCPDAAEQTATQTVCDLLLSYRSVTHSDVTERRHADQCMVFAQVLSPEAADIPYDWFYLKGAVYLTGLSAPRVKEEHFCDRVKAVIRVQSLRVRTSSGSCLHRPPSQHWALRKNIFTRVWAELQ